MLFKDFSRLCEPCSCELNKRFTQKTLSPFSTRTGSNYHKPPTHVLSVWSHQHEEEALRMSVCEARIILLQTYFHHQFVLITSQNYFALLSNIAHVLSQRGCWLQCKLLQSCEESKFQSSHITAVISAVAQVLINQAYNLNQLKW